MASVHPDLLLDQWSALAHKAGLDPTTDSALIPNWVPADDRRRLTAYRVLDAYLGNVARRLLVSKIGPTAADEIREFGDPRVLVSRIVAGVVGTAPALMLPAAAEPPPSSPPLLDEPPPARDDDADVIRAAREAQRQAWEQNTADSLNAWSAALTEWPRVTALSGWLTEWQHRVRYAAKVYEAESQSVVPLGDGVLVMGLDDGNPWPTLTVIEPDAYYPVLDPSNTDDYPSKVHLAWEYEDGERQYLRRITYQLVELDAPRSSPWGIDRTHACEMTDLTWDLTGAARYGWNALSEDTATPAEMNGEPVVNRDLGIDWIPVLHLPNTPATQTHYGRSSIAPVTQVFDSISQVDTDIERAAAIAGLPILGIEGDTPTVDLKLKPGLMLNGKITSVDLSAALSALRALQGDLLDRLAVNAEVPGPVMGRVDANVIPSGVALALLHDPFETLVNVLRLTRASKYPMLGRWAIRWAQLNGTIEPGETPTVEAAFPSSGIRDTGGVVGWVGAAHAAGIMSRETAIEILRTNGVPIDDAEAELDRLRRSDTTAALQIADATGSEVAAAQHLGIDLEALTEPTTALNPDGGPPQFGAS